MVVKSELKLIKNLQQKRYRNEHGLFVVEGKKVLEELIDSKFKPYKILALAPEHIKAEGIQTVKISNKELSQISNLKNPNGFIGVFHMLKPNEKISSDWILALDGVQDPGNLGTIIRLCDWFGVTDIICSKDTVDCFNPKVLQATMGSIARVSIRYTSLPTFLRNSKLPSYGTFMDGVGIAQTKLPKQGIIVMGNEGHGISEEIESLCTIRLAIPQFSDRTTESLNVASATAILLHEIRR